MSRPGTRSILLLMTVALPAAGQELPTAPPAEVGLSAAKLAEIKPALERLVDGGQIAGSVSMVLRRGKVADLTVVGFRDLESKAPMAEDTIFAIASMTKPVTCVGAMKLVEAGKIALDDPASKYLPELADLKVLTEAGPVPAKKPVTVRDLFAHTAGFTYGFIAPDPRLAAAYREARVEGPTVPTIAEQVKRLATVPLVHEPGERWTYGLSNDVLGRLIEVVSGQPLDQYLEAEVLGPLDLRDTSFLVPESKRDRVATIYRAGDGGSLTPLGSKNFGSATFFAGGAGLFSTARDYARFAQMLLDGGELDGVRILSADSVAQMTSNQIGDNEVRFGAGPGSGKFGLGFGVALGPDGKATDFGWGGIFSTNFRVHNDTGVVEVVMTQVLPTNHGDAAGVVSRIVAAAIEP